MHTDFPLKLADCLQRLTENFSSANILNVVDEKFETFNKLLDDKFCSFFLQMQQMLQQQKK
jgi:hypothetical protein